MANSIITNCPKCNEECHTMLCTSCSHEFLHPGIADNRRLKSKLKAKDKIIKNMEEKLKDLEDLKSDEVKEIEDAAFLKGKQQGYKDHKIRAGKLFDDLSEENISQGETISSQSLQIKKLKAKLKSKDENEHAEIFAKAKQEARNEHKVEIDQLKTDHSLKLSAVQKQYNSFREKHEEIINRGDLKSQQLQGSVGQIHIEKILEKHFPDDEVVPVKTGVRGADVKLRIFKNGKYITTILIEVKNTINSFQKGWVPKLESDLMASDATVAILVCHNPPEDPFAHANRGIFLTTYQQIVSLIATLRVALFREQRLIKNNENKNEKAAIIYQVLTSEKFANQVRRIFEVYSAMLKQVEKDDQYHTKSAATRKAQLQNFGNFMMDLLGFLEGQGDGDDFTKLVESFDITDEKNENVSIAFTK